MNSEEFERIFETQVGKCRDILVQKAKEYATDVDRLHNFKVGAVLSKNTPEQTLWGYLTKHLTSLSDMVASGQDYPEALWDEKLGDTLNYLFLLRAQLEETWSKKTIAGAAIPYVTNNTNDN